MIKYFLLCVSLFTITMAMDAIGACANYYAHIKDADIDTVRKQHEREGEIEIFHVAGTCYIILTFQKTSADAVEHFRRNSRVKLEEIYE